MHELSHILFSIEYMYILPIILFLFITARVGFGA